MSIITRIPDLEKVCAEIDNEGRFALDLEFIPENSYIPRLCLVQVATRQGPYIIDPLQAKDLSTLWARVSDPRILTVLHAADQDIALIYHDYGTPPQNIMDTQIAAGFCGFGFPVGYGKLLGEILNVNLSKTETYTNWLERPLTSSQVDYALDDVRYLLSVNDVLSETLNRQGRLQWVIDECKERYQSPRVLRADPEVDFHKIKGAGVLSRRSLAVLRELFRWREEAASLADRPTRTVLPDNVLLELARRPVKSVADIQRIRGVRPDQVAKHGRAIVDATRQALAIPDSQCPEKPNGLFFSRDDALQSDVLYTLLKVICAQAGLAPDLVGTRNELSLFMRAIKEGNGDFGKTVLGQGWRYELAGGALRSLLEGGALTLAFGAGDSAVSFELKDSSK